MITVEDIARFQEDTDEAIRAADTYARRREKGIPPDRWADGVRGEHMVALGIRALQETINIQADAMSAMLEDIQSRTYGVTDATKDPCRRE